MTALAIWCCASVAIGLLVGRVIRGSATPAPNPIPDREPPKHGFCPISGLPYEWMYAQWEERQHVRQQSKEAPP